MSKDEKCTCKACKNTVFHCHICKFMGFLLPSSSSWLLKLPKGQLAKLSNIDADANVSQFSRAGNTCCGNKFCCSETKSVFAWSQKHFCFPDTNFAFETYVSQFSHPGKHNKKHWARSIQPKFPEISVQNSMDRFGPTGKVSKKRVHLLRWSSFPGRTGWNFG